MSVTLSISIKTPPDGIDAVGKKADAIISRYDCKQVSSGYYFAGETRDLDYHFPNENVVPEPLLTELCEAFPGIIISCEDDDVGHER